MRTTFLGVLAVLALVSLAVPGAAQTTGAFPSGNPTVTPALRQAVLSSEHSYALPLPDAARANFEILRTLLSRAIPAPQDLDLAATGKVLAARLDAAAKQPASPCDLFSITAAFAFVGKSPPVILAVSLPCGTAILVRSRTGGPPKNAADIEWSPQFETAPFDDLLALASTH
jgi:hypothetical protein